jgi:hypothetical protein
MKLAVAAVSALLWLGLCANARAAPASAAPSSGAKGSASVGVDKSGAKSSSSSSSSGYDWPDFVYGGNAVSLMLPFQIGLVGYEPRVRLGLQYDRQLYKRHWVYIGVASLLDRGDHATFKEKPCGREDVEGERICQPGAVAGFDAYAGWTYKFFVEKRPYLVPLFRAGLGGGFWKYPRIGGALQQDIDRTWSLSARVGSGLRVFLLRDLAVGMDLNFAIGFGRHRSDPVAMGIDRKTTFLLGLELLPNVEYRF